MLHTGTVQWLEICILANTFLALTRCPDEEVILFKNLGKFVRKDGGGRAAEALAAEGIPAAPREGTPARDSLKLIGAGEAS